MRCQMSPMVTLNPARRAASPGSRPALLLIMQGRYRIDGYAFLRWNAAYVLKSLGVAVALLHLYALLLGVAA